MQLNRASASGVDTLIHDGRGLSTAGHICATLRRIRYTLPFTLADREARCRVAGLFEHVEK